MSAKIGRLIVSKEYTEVALLDTTPEALWDSVLVLGGTDLLKSGYRKPRKEAKSQHANSPRKSANLTAQ